MHTNDLKNGMISPTVVQIILYKSDTVMNSKFDGKHAAVILVIIYTPTLLTSCSVGAG